MVWPKACAMSAVMTRISSISRALVLADKRSVPARIEAPKKPAPKAAAPRRAPAPLALVPSVEGQTAAAGIEIQLTRGPQRRGLKADANERARYARAYRPAPDLTGRLYKVSA